MGTLKTPETRQKLLEAARILRCHNKLMRSIGDIFNDDDLYDNLSKAGKEMLKLIRIGWCRSKSKYVEFGRNLPNGMIYCENLDPKGNR